MNNTVTMMLKVLRYSGGQFKDDTGRDVKYSNAIVNFGGRELKVNSEADLTQFVEKDIEAAVRITPKGSGDAPQMPVLTVVSAKPAK